MSLVPPAAATTPVHHPRTPRISGLGQALTRPRFLVTRWPWRAMAYLLTTGPVAGAAAVPLLLLGLPWLLLLAPGALTPDRWGRTAVLLLFGAALLAAGGPLVATPLGTVERHRLRLVDDRPLPTPYIPSAGGLRAWLKTRYTTRQTWGALAYAMLLVTVLPVAYAAVTTLLVILAGCLVSPLLAEPGDPVALGFATVGTAAEAWPYAIGALLLLPTVPYVLGLLAAGHAALARLLLGSDQQQLRRQLVEVARSRSRLVDAFEAERRRIERDLHDGAQQRLVALTLGLGLAKLDVPAGSPTGQALTEAHRQAKDLLAELRELIRGIHPQSLVEGGLATALPELVHRSPLPVDLEVSLAHRPPASVESTVYFVVAEALTNVARHSGAGRATVVVRRQADLLVVEVADDGHGGADPGAGSGLTGLADRVAAVDGRLLLSSPVGGPSLLRVELPC